MTPSILKLEGSRPNLNLVGIAHYTRGQNVHIGVYSEPKPKRGIIIELLKHFLWELLKKQNMMIALKVLVFMNKSKFLSFPFKNNFSKNGKEN
jgi:hypothetical protein